MRNSKSIDKKISSVFSLVSLFIVFLGLVGYLPGLRLLGSIRPEFVPMAPSAAVCFIVMGCINLILIDEKNVNKKYGLVCLLLFIIFLFGLSKGLEYVLGIEHSFEEKWLYFHQHLNGIPIGVMSPSTGFLFCFAVLASMSLILKKEHRKGMLFPKYYSGVFSLILVLLSFVFILSYLYDRSFMYGQATTVPMTITTAIAFFSLGIGQVFAMDKNSFPKDILSGFSLESKILRTFLPVIIMAILLHDLVRYLLNKVVPLWSLIFLDAISITLLISITVLLAMKLASKLGSDSGKKEALILKTKYFLEQAQELGKIGSWELDINKNELIWSDENYRIFEVPFWKKHLTYETFTSKVHPDDRAFVEKRLNTAIKNGESYDIDHRLLMDDGSVKWIREEAFLEFNAQGNCIRATGFTQDITERKKYEEELEERETFLNNVGNIAKIGGWEIDLENEGKAKWTKGTYDIAELGYEESIPGLSEHIDWYLPEYHDMIRKKMQALIDTKEPIQFEAMFKTKKGKLKWCRTKGEAIEEKGKVVKLRGTFQDITEQKQTEDDLRESEQKYSSLFENMLNGFALHKIVLDDKGKPVDYIFLEVNKAFEEITGLKAKDIIGKKATEAIPGIENDPADWIGKYGKVALTGKEFWFETKAESIGKWFSVNAFTDEKGYFASVFEDISERKKAEEALRESEENYRNLVEGTDDLITHVDSKGVFTFVNNTSKKIFGFSPSECIGRSAFDFIHPDDREMTKKAFEGWGRDKKQRIVFENRQVNKNGQVFHMLWTINLLLDKAGNVISVVNVARDITKRKQDEQMLQEYKENLENIVEKRTRELKESQKQLLQAEKLASIGQLSAGVAHELNSPLTGLGLMLRSYKKNKDLNDKQCKDLEDMESAVSYMAQIIRDLNTFSRTSVSTTEICNLNDIIDSTLSFSIYQLKKKKINIKKEFAPNLMPVECDKNQMQQVVLNIITNATDALNESGDFIIRTKNEEESGKNFVVMCFEDNGCGIPEDNLNRIFDPFFTTKRPGKGVGLGLSITFNIVKNHGGSISIDSKEKHGTKVTIKVPSKK